MRDKGYDEGGMDDGSYLFFVSVGKKLNTDGTDGTDGRIAGDSEG